MFAGFRFLVVSVLSVAWPVAALLAAEGGKIQDDNNPRTARHRAVAQATLTQLLSVMDRPPNLDSWPPKLYIKESNEPNAFASIDRSQGKRDPIMVVYTAEVEKTAEFNSDELAFTIGHELGHLALGHVLANSEKAPANATADPPSEIFSRAFSRQNEIDADHFGMDLALKANFTWQAGIRNLIRSAKEGPNYNSYEGYFVDHPNWPDRIALLDKDRANWWRSMSAFDNGAFFLSAEQYPNAELCYRRIVKDFPDCAEAWANRGYAQLMMYCDALDPDDVRQFDLGQIVIGGFYRRSPTFELPRQVAKDLWSPAVESLQKALELNPNLILAKGNLAIAYLVNPDGKDVKKATALFDEIDEQLKDPEIAKQFEDHPEDRLALLNNATVARSEGTADVAAVEKLWDDVASRTSRISSDSKGLAFNGAVDFNRASALAKSPNAKDRQSAEDLLANYLAKTPTSAIWWPLAYDRYVAVCKQLAATPKTKDELAGKRSAKWRLTTGLPIDDKRAVNIADTLDEVVATLGKPDSTTTLIKETPLKKLNYDSLGMSLVFYDGLIAIMLHGDKAVKLPILGTGVGSASEVVTVGMPREEFEANFGADRPFGQVDDAEVQYRFYEELGVAVRFKAGKVVEVVIAPLSRTPQKQY